MGNNHTSRLARYTVAGALVVSLLFSGCTTDTEIDTREFSADLAPSTGPAATAVAGTDAMAPELDLKDLCDSMVLAADGIDAMIFIDQGDFDSSLGRLTQLLDSDPSISYAVSTPDDVSAEMAAVIGMDPGDFAQEIGLGSNGIIEIITSSEQALTRSHPVIADLLADPAVFAHTLASDSADDPPSVFDCF